METTKVWNLLDTGGRDGAWNMACDLKLLAAAERKEIGPTLRFYRWEPPAVSLGATQKAEEEVSIEFCRREGIPVVRRPSGGGAIFHDDELTYSFVARTEAHPDFGDLLKSYYLIIEGLRRGLAGLGVPADTRGGAGGGSPERYLPCFALASRHDLTSGGKKLIGSAQKRRRQAFLQHGSLPFSYRPELVNRIFLRPENFFEKATCLTETLGGRRPPETAVKQALQAGLESVFGCSFQGLEFKF
ncbi:MAG TPA: lipoate--protein ligase family protein [bacterium]|uniref:Octanoyltransferase LipM n=1 Tax=candidate division TA06 bacterium ADurb.Bin417 TaxID=1852828 RepID=A0A1V5MII6_UNCT6|nr:MAG: Octanoyltransferase LipM [candidate division TA06 bacterium ADurb.Bin417]HNQ36046.1 lipoate--protein ligase family protein [bacterium]HNS48074.1 lipoate--protein ligase family protein [bacterium]